MESFFWLPAITVQWLNEWDAAHKPQGSNMLPESILTTIKVKDIYMISEIFLMHSTRLLYCGIEND